MPKHKDQRVGVFVDVQNLYYSAKQFYNAKVNFAHILHKAVAGRSLIRAIAYVIKADVKAEENFFDALEHIGYDVRSKDLQTFYTGAKKGDWDVGIAMDIMRMASKLDVVVLVSGDGDFKDLLEHVKALGCRAEAIAFGKTSSSRLTNEADEFYDLAKDLDKALIGYKKPVANPQDHTTRNKRPPKSFNNRKEENNKPRGPRPNYTNNNNNFKKDEPSFMQLINMDQPLDENKPPIPKGAVIPQNTEPSKEGKKEPVKKSTAKKSTKSKKTKSNDEQKPTETKAEDKPKTAEKPKKSKKESVMSKVLKRVTKKKE